MHAALITFLIGCFLLAANAAVGLFRRTKADPFSKSEILLFLLGICLCAVGTLVFLFP